MIINKLTFQKVLVSRLTPLITGVNQGKWRPYCEAQSQVHCTMEKSWPKVILFGDSLTQYGFGQDGCWAALIADYLQRKCDVINRGFSGYNSRWCKLILPKLVTRHDAQSTQLVTILLGANDSVDSALCPKQHVPLDEYKDNMKQIIQYFLDLGIERQKIIVISPPSCVEAKWREECRIKGKPFGKFNEPTKAYASCSMDVAKECGTKAVDLYTNMMRQQEWEDMLNDGLHFSTKGSLFLFELLKPHLEKVNDALPMQLPYWADIDNENPTAELDKY